MTIVPRNTDFDFEYGWKVKPDECGKSAGEEYLKCLEERAYPKNEIFVDGLCQKILLSISLKIAFVGTRNDFSMVIFRYYLSVFFQVAF